MWDGAMTALPQEIILTIDDSPENLYVLNGILCPEYRVLASTSGERGLQIAANLPKPDLILLDVMMPGIDGYTTLARLQESNATRDIPVIFVTALADAGDEERGLRLGAADYITKPINPVVAQARVRTQLEAKRSRDALKNLNGFLEVEVNRRMIENNLTQQVAIRALAHLAETRDSETGDHLRRTQGYIRQLAIRLKQHPRFSATLNNVYIDLLTDSAPLHDIGKVGIPDHILLKPGRLTPAEMSVMKTHAKLGSDSIELAERDIEAPVRFLLLAKEIAHWHHERWDGNGYPDGLIGDEIPVSARLMALADVFDAMTTKRVYKPAIDFGEARELIVAERGKHFDPDVVDAFIAGFDDFISIGKQHQDVEMVLNQQD